MYRVSEKPGTTTCFLFHGLGKQCQWSGHHNHLTTTLWTLYLAIPVDTFVTLDKRITDCCAAVQSNMLGKMHTNALKRLIKCAVSGRIYREYK
jgi:hypothetical protein